jgi:hypothetical protein
VYIFFPGYVADNAMCVWQILSDLVHSVPTARDEGYSCAAIQQLADKS